MVMELLKELGYSCVAEKLKASDFGVPQRRTRFYIVGLRDASNLAESNAILTDRIPQRIQACRRDIVLPRIVRISANA